MPPCWIGLDVGSGSVRASLLDGKGVLRLVTRRPLHPRSGAERLTYDPREILAAASACLTGAARRAPRASLLGAGLAVQRSTFLIWRRSDGRPLTPAFGWQSRDGILPRSPGEARSVARLTGLRWSPHYAGPRAAALLRRRPRLRRLLLSGAACLGTLDAFLLYRWTRGATFRTDPTHAQRTLLYSPARGTWEPRLLRRFGIPARCLPEVGPSAGWRLWLPEIGVPLTASCGDQQAAFHAVQICVPRACMVNYGTGAFVLAQAPPRSRRPAGLLLAETASLRGGRARAFEAPVPTGASSFELLRAGGASAPRAARPPRLVRRSSARAGGEKSLSSALLIAATHGLGAPFWIERSPSLLLFDRLPEGPAAEEAAEFSIASSVQAALERLGGPARRLVAAGGLSERDGLLQIQADLLGRPVDRARPAEWTALGAALMSASARRPPRPRVRLERFLPRRQMRSLALARYRVWIASVRFLRRIGPDFNLRRHSVVQRSKSKS